MRNFCCRTQESGVSQAPNLGVIQDANGGFLYPRQRFFYEGVTRVTREPLSLRGPSRVGSTFIATAEMPMSNIAEFPSPLLFDERYKDPKVKRTTRHFEAQKTKEQTALPYKVPQCNSLGLLALAHPPVEQTVQKPVTNEDYALPSIQYITRRHLRTLQHIPFPECPVDFVESCAIAVSAVEPTPEEAIQNTLSLELFHPGWYKGSKEVTRRGKSSLDFNIINVNTLYCIKVGSCACRRYSIVFLRVVCGKKTQH